MPTTGIVTEIGAPLPAVIAGTSDVGTAPQGVCIAFTDDTLEPAPVWTRIDAPLGYDFVNGWTIDRGRSSELDRTKTGTATVSLIDTTGNIDPTKSTGPFFGNIDPMKQAAIALQNPVTNQWSTIFRGFADWSWEFDTSEQILSGTLEMSDAFDLLASLEMTPGHIGDTAPTGSEGDIFLSQDKAYHVMNKALTDGGWPAALRAILTGNVYVGDARYSGTIYARRDQLLSVLMDIADAEFPGVANVFMSKTGKVVFHGRYARFDPTNPDWGIKTWKVGDLVGCGGAEYPNRAPISSLQFRRSKDDIINAALCLPMNVADSDVPGALQTDSGSIATYGWRSISYDNLLTLKGRTSPYSNNYPVNAVNETTKYAQYYVQNYRNPHTRVTGITLRSFGNIADPLAAPVWALICGVEIGDVINLLTLHPWGGGFNENYYVEGIRYTAAPMRSDMPEITLELDLSPQSLYAFNPF